MYVVGGCKVDCDASKCLGSMAIHVQYVQCDINPQFYNFSRRRKNPRALVITPTRELCQQVTRYIESQPLLLSSLSSYWNFPVQEHSVTFWAAALCVPLWWCAVWTSGREGRRGRVKRGKEEEGEGVRERERERKRGRGVGVEWGGMGRREKRKGGNKWCDVTSVWFIIIHSFPYLGDCVAQGSWCCVCHSRSTQRSLPEGKLCE